MKIKKTSVAAFVIALCLVGGVTAVFATSALADNGEQEITYVAEVEDNLANTVYKEPAQQELVARYGTYGLSFDANGKILFNGELVRYFCDGVELGEGSWSIWYEYLNESGTTDVFTKRKVINNGDGSKDPFGDLIGLEESSQEEFNQRDSSSFYAPANPITYDEGDNNIMGITFAERFSIYKEYGIVYKGYPRNSGSGNVYYNGQLVKTFIDEAPNGGVFSYASRDGGKSIIHTVYDNKGNLIGVEQR